MEEQQIYEIAWRMNRVGNGGEKEWKDALSFACEAGEFYYAVS